MKPMDSIVLAAGKPSAITDCHRKLRTLHSEHDEHLCRCRDLNQLSNPAPYMSGMNQKQKITGYMRAMFYALTDLASNIDSGREDFQIEMKISGGEVTFDPVEISTSKISEPTTRKALKLNEVLEDAGYPKVAGVLISFFVEDGQIGFSLVMENEPDEKQREVVASAFDGLDD